MGFGVNYPGDPTAVESPSPAILPGDGPTVYLPDDADGGTWANAYQAMKALADQVAYLQQPGRRMVWQPNYAPHPTAAVDTSANPLPGDPNLQAVVSAASASESYQFVNGSAVALPSPYGSRLCRIKAGTNGERTILSGVHGFWQKGCTTQQVCFEQHIAIIDKTKGNYSFGLSQNADPQADVDGIRLWFSANSGDHWQLQAGGTFANIGGGGIPSATMQKMRMVISGAATPRGVAAGNTGVIRVWQNDVLLYTYTGSLTTAANTDVLTPHQESKAEVTGIADAYFSPWTISWNPA